MNESEHEALHLLWRATRSSGEAPGVYLQQGDLPGSVLTPDKARTLSRELLSAADDAERGRITALTRAWYQACGTPIDADDCGVSMVHMGAGHDAYRPWHLACFRSALGIEGAKA
jgi:hypothetical protein